MGARVALVCACVVCVLAIGEAQRPANCPVGPDAILKSLGNQGNSSDGKGPAEVISGCTYQINVPYKEELYLKLARPAPGTRLSIEYDYKGEFNPPVHLFSWGGQCCGGMNPYISVSNQAYYADFGFEPLTFHSTKVYKGDPVNGRDEFHCFKACQYYLPTEHMEDLLITISTWMSYGGVQGTVTFTYQEAHPLIKADQLQAVKDVYDSCCAPRLPPNGKAWSWEDYKKHNLTDSYQKPYCDWLPGGWGSGWDTNSCENIDNVFCDSEGNVVDLILSDVGLQCNELPASVASLQKLEVLEMGSNQIAGTIPSALLALGTLRTVSLRRNLLEGPVACPQSAVLEEFDMAYNMLEGTVPDCLSSSPKLATIRLQSNRLSGTIPPALAGESSLVELDLSQNSLTGPIPPEISHLPLLAYLRLSRNHLSGVLPPNLVPSLKALYELDVSFNELSGPFPDVDSDMVSLHNLLLGHNDFSGEVTDQFRGLLRLLENSESQEIGRTIVIDLGSNRFSGPLPHEVYSLQYSPLFKVGQLTLGGNHFRCDRETSTWPDWALRMDVSPGMLGECVPVAQAEGAVVGEEDGAAGVSVGEVWVGRTVTVTGRSFRASPELTCRLEIQGRPEPLPKHDVRASYIGPERVACTIPAALVESHGMVVGEEIHVSVANYGQDFYSEGTVKDFHPVELFLVAPPVDSHLLEVLVIAALGLVACGLGGFLCCVIRRERRGEPMFMRLDDPAAHPDGMDDLDDAELAGAEAGEWSVTDNAAAEADNKPLHQGQVSLELHAVPSGGL